MGEDDVPVEIPVDGVLDLHTFRPREVRDLVNDWLDACRAQGLGEVRIVHGKGTGSLQRTVHALLDRRDDVARYALAPAERGGWGATVAFLRPGTCRVVGPSEWVAVPWRNGGGITHEIAREGPVDAFSWRVSLAEVERAGPFSRFPGVDRVIALVEGEGFALDGDVRAEIREPGEPFAFPGDVDVRCALLGGPVRDLNLMVDRARWDLVAERARLGPGTVPIRCARALSFVLGGEAEIDGVGRAGRHDLIVSERDLVLRGAVDAVVGRLYRR